MILHLHENKKLGCSIIQFGTTQDRTRANQTKVNTLLGTNAILKMGSTIQGKNSNRVKCDALKLSVKTVHLEVWVVNAHLNFHKNKK